MEYFREGGAKNGGTKNNTRDNFADDDRLFETAGFKLTRVEAPVAK